MTAKKTELSAQAQLTEKRQLTQAAVKKLANRGLKGGRYVMDAQGNIVSPDSSTSNTEK